MGSLSGSLDEFGNRRILEWFEEVHWEARETGANLFHKGRTFVGAEKWVRTVMKSMMMMSVNQIK